MSLSVGDSFDSYSELKDCIREFECANHTQLVHRDSRTLTAKGGSDGGAGGAWAPPLLKLFLKIQYC